MCPQSRQNCFRLEYPALLHRPSLRLALPSLQRYQVPMALITSATAADMARKSHAARKAALDALRIAANPIPLPDPDDYTSRRLFRVREQVERLSDMLDEETDPQKLDRIACALARVSEIERQLAMRPMPGSRRPAADPAVDSKPQRQLPIPRPPAMPPPAGPPTPLASSPPQVEQEEPSPPNPKPWRSEPPDY